MEKTLQMWKIHFRHHLLYHTLTALLLCGVAPLIMGVQNLDVMQTARITEMYLSLLGIVLLLPVFIPDQDKNIRELILSKKESYLPQLLLRLLQQIAILAVLIALFLLFLKAGSCEFEFWKFYFATIANCLALGGTGILFYALSDSIATGYMVPVLYYILCYGAGRKYLGKFYLFSLLNQKVTDKWWLAGLAVLLIALGLASRVYLVRKRSFSS